MISSFIASFRPNQKHTRRRAERDHMKLRVPPKTGINDKVILFDGICKFCNAWSKFIIRFDKNKVFKLASLQSDAGQELLKTFHIPTDSFETMFLVEGNRIHEKTSAFLRIIKCMPFPWYLLTVLVCIPPFLRNWVYDRVAKNRYRLFGKYDSCIIPDSTQSDRFLS